MRSRELTLALLFVAALLGPSSLAGGHVGVLPAQVEAGSPQAFSVRVPSEREVPTTSVRVVFPPQILVYSFAPAPGWQVRPLRAPDGRYRGVVFSGGRIGAGSYVDFEMLGTPRDEGMAVWRSTQTYADGVVKRWTGPPEQPGEPAPETGPDVPGPAAAVRIAAAEGLSSVAVEGGDPPTGIILAAIAMLIAAGSIALSIHLWRTAPGRER